jgi:hypothetical protein
VTPYWRVLYPANSPRQLLIRPEIRLRFPTLAPEKRRKDGARESQVFTGRINSDAPRQASPELLNEAANTLLMVKPSSLRDSQFAVSCAERAVALSHRKAPSMLLILAQAYRASGKTEKSRTTADEGLALLPTAQPGRVKPRIRKLLEIQTQTAR